MTDTSPKEPFIVDATDTVLTFKRCEFIYGTPLKPKDKDTDQ